MRLHNLQALRGAACLVVVLYHALALWGPDGVVKPLQVPVQCFDFGAVDVFFLLPRRGFLPGLGVWFAAVIVANISPEMRARFTPENGHGLGWWLNLCMTEFVSGCALAVLVRRGRVGGGRLALTAGLAGF